MSWAHDQVLRLEGTGQRVCPVHRFSDIAMRRGRAGATDCKAF